MADGLPHTKGVAPGWFVASFFFSCGEVEGEQREDCSFSWQSTKIIGLWKTSEGVVSLETQFFTDQQHSIVSLGHGIVAHPASIGREKSGTLWISWGELQLLIQQPSTYSGKDGTKSMTLSSNLAFPRETHKIEKNPKNTKKAGMWKKVKRQNTGQQKKHQWCYCSEKQTKAKEVKTKWKGQKSGRRCSCKREKKDWKCLWPPTKNNSAL